jgi:hypothetical protein
LDLFFIFQDLIKFNKVDFIPVQPGETQLKMPAVNPLQNLPRKPLWKYEEGQGDVINGDSENIQHCVD